LPDLDQGKATQIQQNYLRKKNELESRLRCGPSQLEKIRSEFNQRRDALLSKVDAIVPRLAQAKADNELIQKEMN